MLESCQKSMSSGVKRYKWWRTGRWEVAIKTTEMGELVKTLAIKYICFKADIFFKKYRTISQLLTRFQLVLHIFGDWSVIIDDRNKWHRNLNVHLKSQRCFPKTKQGITNRENVIKDKEKKCWTVVRYQSFYMPVSAGQFFHKRIGYLRQWGTTDLYWQYNWLKMGAERMF